MNGFRETLVGAESARVGAATDGFGKGSSLRSAELRLADDTLVEPLGDVMLLFSEQKQQLSRLEGASGRLVCLLKGGATFDELASELRNAAVDGEAAEEWVSALLNQLAALSMLQADVAPSPQPYRQSFQLGGARFDLSYSTDELRGAVAPIFAHLEEDASSRETSFAIGEFGAGLVGIAQDGNAASLVARNQLAVRIKGLVLEQVLEDRGSFAALHAALISDGDDGVLLLGPPGAGKSTLALALVRRGYNYGSDDVTFIDPDGTVTGVPLAPAVKAGSWTIADELGADLTLLPAHERSDGQQVRFARIAAGTLVRPHCPVNKIVRLRRSARPGCELRQMGPEDVLAELFRESRASGGECTLETMSGLARLVRGAAAFHLDYSEAIEAAELIAAHRQQ